MKFKEQRGNVFVFDGGYAGGELELRTTLSGDAYVYETSSDLLIIDKELNISCEYVSYTDIQTAVNLMQILINEGLL